jgi:hypothetical protein
VRNETRQDGKTCGLCILNQPLIGRHGQKSTAGGSSMDSADSLICLVTHLSALLVPTGGLKNQ